MFSKEILSIVAIGVISILLSVLIFFKVKDRKLAYILIAALGIRLLFLFIHAFVLRLPDSQSDAITFEALGWQSAQLWHQGVFARGLTGPYHYAAIIAVIYFICGHVPLIIQFLNVIFGICIVYIIYKITMELSDSILASRLAAGIATVFPMLVLYSAIILREGIIILFFTLSVFYLIRWFKVGRNKYAFLAILFLVCSGLFHWGMLILFLAYAPFLVFYNPMDKKWSRKINFLLAGFLVVAVLFVKLVMYADNLSVLPGFDNQTIELSSITTASPIATIDTHLNNYTKTGRAAYLNTTRPHNYIDLVFQTPVRVVFFLLSPFPWNIHNNTDLIGFFDVMLYIVLIVGSIYGLRSIFRKDKAIGAALLSLIVVFLIVFAWGVSNYGASVRHRNKISFVLIALASIGYASMFQKSKTPKEDFINSNSMVL